MSPVPEPIAPRTAGRQGRRHDPRADAACPWAGPLAVADPPVGRHLPASRPDDELRLYVRPVVIWRSKPLFAPSDVGIDLRLVESRTVGNGVVLVRYHVAG